MIARRLVFFVALVFLSLTAASAADDLAPLRALSRGEPLAMRGLPNLAAPATPPAPAVRSVKSPIVAALADGTCPVGYFQCTDGCVDIATSTSDCGACGIQCKTGAVCTAGVSGRDQAPDR